MTGLPPLIPREVLFGNPEKASPELSPDGTRLAYLAPHEGVLNVWVRTLGERDDRVVTNDRKRGIRFFSWLWTGDGIVYLQDSDGDENWHLYRTSLESGETVDLTPHPGAQAQPVASEPTLPHTLLLALNVRDPRLHDVYRLDLRDGALALDTENPGDVNGWAADNRLRVRVAQAFDEHGGTIVRVRDDASSPWRELLRWGPDETFGGVASFTPDDRGVWLISSVGANASRLIELDLATGDQAVIAEDPHYDVGGILQHPRTHALEAVHFVRARGEWSVLDPAVAEDFELLAKVRPGDWSVMSRDLEDRRWVVGYVEDAAPVHYYVWDRARREASLLFTNRPRLEACTLSRMEPVAFEARDGMRLHGYLTLPAGLPGPGPLPAVVLVHGGPWVRDVWGLDNEVQWLANRGYAVLQVNYRGSTGYGKDYLNAGDREWGAAMSTDLLDGKAWMVARGIADPARVAVMGGSYGGYAVLAALAFTPDEFACGVDVVGPSSLVTLIESIPPYWTTARATFDKRMGRIETERAFLESRSPLFRCHDIRRPLLIAQGANDPRVKQAESDQIVAAMRERGLEVTYLLFEDEGHGFARPENQRKFVAAVEPFLARHLGGRVEPPADEERWDDVLR
jgi:dipeptidyl aminopeptidase/acylaminoacyl peptidase